MLLVLPELFTGVPRLSQEPFPQLHLSADFLFPADKFIRKERIK